jgi:hypothetical protein
MSEMLRKLGQTLAMLNIATGEVVKTTLKNAGNNVREFIPIFHGRCVLGIEGTRSMLGIDSGRITGKPELILKSW